MTIKKNLRQIKEISISIANRVLAPNDSLLNDIIPQLFTEIASRICSKDEGRVKEAIELMDYFNITLNQFKENFMDLCSNSVYAHQYEEMPSTAKMAFTKLYNKSHLSMVKKSKKTESDDIIMKDNIDPELNEMNELNDDNEENQEMEIEVEVEIKAVKTDKEKKGKNKKKSKPKKA